MSILSLSDEASMGAHRFLNQKVLWILAQTMLRRDSNRENVHIGIRIFYQM